MSITYVEPRTNISPEDCNFYHAMDIPGLGEVGREWDLRDNIDNYLGNQDLTGKRVLDVGTASGYLTFEMEKRGGDMVSFDMETGRQWNVVPHCKLSDSMDEMYENVVRGHNRLQNAYWYAHNAFNSKAKVFYGDIYNIPEELGQFDVVFFGMILSHLRDPFQALYSASRLSKDKVIITNQARSGGKASDVIFLPSKDSTIYRAWWSFSDNALIQMLGVLGFEVESIKRDQYKCIEPEPGTRECTTFIARRV